MVIFMHKSVSLDIFLGWISERRYTGSDYMNFFMAFDIHIDKLIPKKKQFMFSVGYPIKDGNS